jgi:acetyl esterase/lipase
MASRLWELIARYGIKSQKVRAQLFRETYRYGKSDDETLDWYPSACVLTPSDQVRRAIVWIAKNASQLGADPAQLHLCDHSSGAHLAAPSLTSDWAAFGLADTSPIKSASCISGVFDLEPVTLSARGNYISLNPSEIDALSPIRHRADIRCPVLVSAIGHDTFEFRRHSREFSNALDWNGVLGDYLLLENNKHSPASKNLRPPTVCCRGQLRIWCAGADRPLQGPQRNTSKSARRVLNVRS